MPSHLLRGIKYAYDDAGLGPPLLLLAGISSTRHAWAPLLPALSPRFRCLAVDNRGCGDSTDDPRVDLSIHSFAEDAVALLDALRIERAHVLGLSMGGMIALDLAVAFPERVDRLLVGCTTLGGAAHVSARPEVMARFLGRAGMDPLDAERHVLPCLFSEKTLETEPGLLEEWIDLKRKAPIPAEVIARRAAAVVRFDVSGRASAIRSPTLVLTGAEDALVPPANAGRIAAAIPGARLVTLPGGHCFFLESREAFEQEVLGFLG